MSRKKFIKRFHIVFDVRESTSLFSITIYKNGLSVKCLTNEDTDYITIPIPNVLIDTKNIVGTNNIISKSKLLMSKFQITLYGILCDTVWIDRLWTLIFSKRRSLISINCHTRSKDNLCSVSNTLVNQISGNDKIITIIKITNKRRKSFGRIGSEMNENIRLMLLKKFSNFLPLF